MKTKLKIIYFLEIFPEISETFILDEIVEAEKQGVHVDIVSLHHSRDTKHHPEAETLIPKTVYLKDISLRQQYGAALRMFCRNPIRCVQFLWYLYHEEKYVRDTRNRFLEVAYLSMFIRGQKIQHIHAHFANKATSYAMWVHMLAGVPYTFTSHRYDIFDVVSHDLPLKTKYSKAHIAISEYNKKYLAEQIGCPLEKILLLYIGININRYGYCNTNASNMMITVGRLEHVKGHIYLIEACKQLKERGLLFKCQIIGSGTLKETLDKKICELGLKEMVELTGPKTNDEILAYYQNAKLFVLPSLSEGLATVLKEALAVGVPVVATNVRGMAEIIKDGQTGLLVPAESADALADQILTLWNDQEKRDIFRRNGRKLVEEHFDLEQQVRQLIEVWRR